jgi:hypothetical protein
MSRIVYPLKAEYAEVVDDCAVARTVILPAEVELLSGFSHS